MKALPLKGIKILDLTRVLAGPWATQLLGDFGAEVLKIESPSGDETRTWGPPFFGNSSGYYLCANRNKKVKRLNLKNEKELVWLKKQIPKYDILIENFKPGDLKKFGLDSKSITKLHPKLIYCSLRGFSKQHAWADRPGYDVIIQGMTGLMSITGATNSEPQKVGVAVSDLLTGLYAANAIQAALFERLRSKKGQIIELSLFDCQLAALANVMQATLMTGLEAKRWGNDHSQIFPYGSFATKDGQIILAIGNDQQFRFLCKTLGKKWDGDKRFASNPNRSQHRDVLRQEIESILTKKTCQEWAEVFAQIPAEQRFPWGPVQTLSQALSQVKNYLVQQVPGIGPILKNPVQFSRSQLSRYSVSKK